MRLCFLLVGLFLQSCLSAATFAHDASPVFIELIERADGGYSLRWKIPPILREGQRPQLRLFGGGCELTSGSTDGAATGFQLYRCIGENADRRIELTYRKDVNPLSTFLFLKTQKGSEISLLVGPDEMVIALPEKATFWSVAQQYVVAGVDHILEGYDHLLFVLCLMVLSGSVKRVLFTVTGFTLGHSVTLGMASLAGWTLSPTFVEPLIAFSILILAVEVAKGDKKTLAYRYPTRIAVGFGLLHGFGFAGALADIGLPGDMKIQALAFFNVGVEVGQILFVTGVFVLYAVARAGFRAVRLYSFAEQGARLAIYPAGVVAAYWTIDRVAGIWL